MPCILHAQGAELKTGDGEQLRWNLRFDYLPKDPSVTIQMRALRAVEEAPEGSLR